MKFIPLTDSNKSIIYISVDTIASFKNINHKSGDVFHCEFETKRGQKYQSIISKEQFHRLIEGDGDDE